VATAKDLRRLALSLEGTTEAPHFDRAAFKAVRIYVTIAADGRTANFKFTPDEQALKCAVAPDAFAAIANAWAGRAGPRRRCRNSQWRSCARRSKWRTRTARQRRRRSAGGSLGKPQKSCGRQWGLPAAANPVWGRGGVGT
jgi:hypothetical protein